MALGVGALNFFFFGAAGGVAVVAGGFQVVGVGFFSLSWSAKGESVRGLTQACGWKPGVDFRMCELGVAQHRLDVNGVARRRVRASSVAIV